MEKTTFNLNEAWKASYASYLREEEEKIGQDFEDLFSQLQEAQAEAEKGFQHIQNYFELYALSEDVIETKPSPAEKEKAEIIKKSDDTLRYIAALAGSGQDNIFGSYKPEVGIETVERISDMKFPKNVIFFVKQLGAWIVRVVLYFINAIRNLIRKIFNRDLIELNPESLKLKLSKIKELETTMIPLDPNQEKSGKPIKVYKLPLDSIKPYVIGKDLKESESVNEGIIDWLSDATGVLGYDKNTKKKEDYDMGAKKAPVLVTVDLSKDIINLKELIQHFYDLFDNAYGSNNEHLFESDDLALLLQLFERAINDIKNGTTSAYEINSGMAELEVINANRLYQNLINTNNNVTALKDAYQQTYNSITNVAKIINNKELLMVSNMGVDFQYLTSSTMYQMSEVLKSIAPRMSEAKSMEKKLNKLEAKYTKINTELATLQRAFSAVSNITYTSVYQKKLSDLFQASKYVTQTVALRISAIGMYIKLLNEVKVTLKMLAAINGKTARI